MSWNFNMDEAPRGETRVVKRFKGETFVIVDIGMRMLVPRELFNAQGFPADYQIDGHWRDGEWEAFPKDVQISCCGNSVNPKVARELVRANCQHLMKGSV